MEKQGVVSIWIGNGPDRALFQQLLEYRITENGHGEWEACPFCRAIGIDSYDPDQFGGSFFAKQLSRPKILFHGTELPAKIEARMSELPPSNCYVLLYNFQYVGEPETFELDGFRFHFLGCFE